MPSSDDEPAAGAGAGAGVGAGDAGTGAAAGAVAQTFVYPLDVVRRRMQTGVKNYRGLFDAIRTIAVNEGVTRGLYRGLSLNYLKTIPNVAIYMSLYDVIKGQLDFD